MNPRLKKDIKPIFTLNTVLYPTLYFLSMTFKIKINKYSRIVDQFFKSVSLPGPLAL